MLVRDMEHKSFTQKNNICLAISHLILFNTSNSLCRISRNRNPAILYLTRKMYIGLILSFCDKIVYTTFGSGHCKNKAVSGLQNRKKQDEVLLQNIWWWKENRFGYVINLSLSDIFGGPISRSRLHFLFPFPRKLSCQRNAYNAIYSHKREVISCQNVLK